MQILLFLFFVLRGKLIQIYMLKKHDIGKGEMPAPQPPKPHPYSTHLPLEVCDW